MIDEDNFSVQETQTPGIKVLEASVHEGEMFAFYFDVEGDVFTLDTVRLPENAEWGYESFQDLVDARDIAAEYLMITGREVESMSIEFEDIVLYEDDPYSVED